MPILWSINRTRVDVGDGDLDGYPDFFTTITRKGQNHVILNKDGTAFDCLLL